MIGPFGRLGAAATLRQHCPQMTQRPGRATWISAFSDFNGDVRWTGGHSVSGIDRRTDRPKDSRQASRAGLWLLAGWGQDRVTSTNPEEIAELNKPFQYLWGTITITDNLCKQRHPVTQNCASREHVTPSHNSQEERMREREKGIEDEFFHIICF